MDPSVSVGTGTPVPGGLTPEESAVLLTEFAREPKVCCIEFTEINPLLDLKGNAMGEVTFDLIRQTTETLEKRLS
jgi:arginase